MRVDVCIEVKRVYVLGVEIIVTISVTRRNVPVVPVGVWRIFVLMVTMARIVVIVMRARILMAGRVGVIAMRVVHMGVHMVRMEPLVQEIGMPAVRVIREHKVVMAVGVIAMVAVRHVFVRYVGVRRRVGVRRVGVRRVRVRDIVVRRRVAVRRVVVRDVGVRDIVVRRRVRMRDVVVR